MRILDARIFSKSFGGKKEIFKKGLRQKIKKKNGPWSVLFQVFL